MVEKTCEWCNGTGQISFFKGVSRFLISCEECPECAGLGYIVVTGSGEKDKKGKKGQSGKTG